MKISISAQFMLLAAARETSRRALAAIQADRPATFFTNQTLLFQEMASQPTIAEARLLHSVFNNMESNIGPLIAGHKNKLNMVREIEPILERQTPMVIETQSGKIAAFSIGELGVLSPVSSWVAEISQADEIKVGLDSFGGCCGVTRLLVEAITEKSNTTVTVTNRAFSAAALLLQSFAHRRIVKSGTIMFHAPRLCAVGTPEEIESDAAKVRTSRKFWVGLIATRTGLPRSAIMEWFISGKDFYFSPEEALKLNLVDEVIEDQPAPDPGQLDGTRAPLPHPDDPVEALALKILGRLQGTFADKARFRTIIANFAAR
jgi:ATP-dependent protease ClpP protease subunit